MDIEGSLKRLRLIVELCDLGARYVAEYPGSVEVERFEKALLACVVRLATGAGGTDVRVSDGGES